MKKYYLVKIESEENYYSCTKIYKAESEMAVIDYLVNNLASDQYLKTIEIIDYESNRDYYLSKVSDECKIYSSFKEI